VYPDLCGFAHRRSIEASAGKFEIKAMGGEIALGGVTGLHFRLTLKCAVADTDNEFKEDVIRGEFFRIPPLES
jgi:hypothetical protein